MIESNQAVPSTHYFLVIDEKRNAVLSFLYTHTMRNPLWQSNFQRMMTPLGITMEEMDEFIKEWGDKEHELGWCNDPTCESNKPKANDGNKKS